MNRALIVLVCNVLVFTYANGDVHIAQSAEYADVVTAYNAAVDGDVVIIPADSATWTNNLLINKGITIMGMGPSRTIITNNLPGMGSWALPLFTLDDSGIGCKRIAEIGMRSNYITSQFSKQGIGVFACGYSTSKRIDHCQFDDLDVGVCVGNSNGESDHNCYYNCANATRHIGYRSTNGIVGQQYAWNNFRPLAFNALNYFFHENEIVELTGDACVADEVEACSYVFRFSKIILREAHGPYSAVQAFPLFDAHGDNPAAGQYSSLTLLLYNNDITIENGAMGTFLTLRGGSALVFNNSIHTIGSGAGTSAAALWEERYRFTQWPKWTDPQYEDVVHNAYIWNNTYNGTVQSPTTDSYSAGHIIIADNPQSNPTANCWTTGPNPLMLPQYPHPLSAYSNK